MTTNARLDRMSWVCIFGGMFLLMLGLWLLGGDATLGQGFAWGGGVLVLVGVLLIWLRSRRADDAAAAPTESR